MEFLFIKHFRANAKTTIYSVFKSRDSSRNLTYIHGYMNGRTTKLFLFLYEVSLTHRIRDSKHYKCGSGSISRILKEENQLRSEWERHKLCVEHLCQQPVWYKSTLCHYHIWKLSQFFTAWYLSTLATSLRLFQIWPNY